MIFRAPKEKVERCIAIAESIISSKPQMSILTNILLETENDRVNVTSTDLEVGIRTSFEAQIEGEGSITLNGSKFLGIVRDLPDGDLIFEVVDNNDVKIKSDNSTYKAKYTLRGIPKENFPTLTHISNNKNAFQIPQKELREMIRKAIFSISFETSRQYLNGIYFESDGKTLKLVSTDGRRLAYIEREFNIGNNIKLNLIVPQKILTELIKYLEDEGIVDISFSENQIFINFNNIYFVSNLIEGNFPNYNQVIPKTQEKFASIKKDLFWNGLKGASHFIDNKMSQVRLDFSENHLIMSINNIDQGSFREEISIDYQGEPIEIAFNHKYMREYLKEVQTDDILMEMNTPLSPVSVKTKEDEKYIYIVMPMKVNG